MRISAVIISATIFFSSNAMAIEGWGVEEQLQKPQTPQSHMPQEPEAVDSDEALLDEILNPEGQLPPATEPAPLEPAEAAPSPNVIDPDAEEGDVAQEQEEPKWAPTKKLKLQGLNKVTARTSEIKAEVDKATRFGNLEIKVEKCLRGPDDEKVENTALISIIDEIPGQQRKEVFRGWMFSSSPAISALEHPIYDVILLSCDLEEKPAEAPKANEKDKAKDAKPLDKKK